MLISQRVPNLQGGISQQPAPLRDLTEVEELENGYTHPSRGLIMRPGTVHRARISTVSTGWENAGVFPVIRDGTNRLRVVIANGDLRVFDAEDGEEYPVTFPAGKDYLLGNGRDYRVKAVGDTAVVVNPNRIARTASRVSEEPLKEALVYVQQGDFSTSYKVRVDGVEFVHTTPDGNSPSAKNSIDTTVIAGVLGKLLKDRLTGLGFLVGQYGSAIHVQRADGNEFDVTATDGQADSGIRVIKDKIQNFEDLPPRAASGFIVEVTGDPTTDVDNYWVVYDDSGAPDGDGVWRETVQPGSLLGLDPSTLPHQLTRVGNYTGKYEVKYAQSSGTPKTSPVPGFEKSGQGWNLIEYRPTDRVTGAPPAPSETRLSFANVPDETMYTPGTELSFTFEGKTATARVGMIWVDGRTKESMRTEIFTRISDIVGNQYEVYQDGADDLVIRPLAPNALPTLLTFAFSWGGDGFPGAETAWPTVELTSPDEIDLSRNAAVVNPADDVVLFKHSDVLCRETGGIGGTNPAIMYDVDTVSVTQGVRVIVQLLSGATVIASASYDSGGVYRKETLSAEGAHSNVEVRLLYSTGEDTFRVQTAPTEGRVTIYGTDRDLGGLLVEGVAAWIVEIPSYAFYPTGASVTVGAASVTAPAGGWEPRQVADALQAALPNTTERIGPKAFKVLGASVNVSSSGTGTTTAFLKGANWEPNEHIGRLVRNLTDGSEGQIVASGPNQITATLSGGSRNRFAAGDLVVVTGLGTSFIFKPFDWRDREVGSLESNPFPSFVDRFITTVFWTQGRLGFCTDDTVSMTASGDLLNFFRESAQKLVTSDPIDLTVALPYASGIHSAFEWDRKLYLNSDGLQVVVSGNPALTPETVRVEAQSYYPTSRNVEPVLMGKELMLTRPVDRATQVLEVRHVAEDRLDDFDISEHVPDLIQGKPISVAGDGALGVFAVATDRAPRNRVWVFVTRRAPDGRRIMASWSKWSFGSDATVVSVDIIDGQMGLVLMRPGGVYLETVDLRAVRCYAPGSPGDCVRYMDRKVTSSTPGASLSSTSVTFPFSVSGTVAIGSQTTGEFQVASPAGGNTYTIPTPLSGNLIAGVLFDFDALLTPMYYRDQSGDPVSRGRTNLTYLDVIYHDTTRVFVDVTLPGRAMRTYSHFSPLPERGRFRVPVHGTNETAQVRIRSSGPGGLGISALDWEANHHDRTRRSR